MAMKLVLTALAVLLGTQAASARISAAENAVWNTHALGVVQSGEQVNAGNGRRLRRARTAVPRRARAV